MLTVHNVLLRGVNSIYLQAVNVEKSEKDVPDFVEYSLQWLKFIDEHHSGEENDIFPRIDAEAGVSGLMQGNIDQHKVFHGGLDAMESYLEQVRDGKQKYSGPKLRDIIDSFMPALRQHLSDEIDTLLGLKKYEDKCDWETFFKAITAEIMKKANDPNIKVRFSLPSQTKGSAAEIKSVHNAPHGRVQSRQDVRKQRLRGLAATAMDRDPSDEMGLRAEAQELVAVCSGRHQGKAERAAVCVISWCQ